MFTKIFQSFSTFAVSWSLFFASLIVNGWNINGFPTYTEDEGTYISQAWAFAQQGDLAIYTYWYDHAPAGWMTLGIWESIIHQFWKFGLSVDSGRVFVVFLVSLTTVVVYNSLVQQTNNRPLSLVATLPFIFSPLCIYFHRQLLLDNIMTFWILVSVYFLLKNQIHLSRAIISGFICGIAILSKESTLFLIPSLLYLLWTGSYGRNRRILVGSWICSFCTIVFLYPMYALLKGEFFPAGTLFGGDKPHVSLLDAWLFQASRKGVSILVAGPTSDVIVKQTWMRFDSFFSVITVLISIVIIVLSFKKGANRFHRMSAIATLCFGFYVLKGPIFSWYIIPIIPFLCFNLALFLDFLSNSIREYLVYYPIRIKILKTFKSIRNNVFVTKILAKPSINRIVYQIRIRLFILLRMTVGLGIVLVIAVQLFTNRFVFTANHTQDQKDVIVWAKEVLNVSSNKKPFIVIDNYSYLDLNGVRERATEANFQYFWKIDSDPAIRDGILQGDWRNIDYLIVTPALWETVKNGDIPMVASAYESSDEVKVFNQTGVYPVSVRKVRKV